KYALNGCDHGSNSDAVARSTRHLILALEEVSIHTTDYRDQWVWRVREDTKTRKWRNIPAFYDRTNDLALSRPFQTRRWWNGRCLPSERRRFPRRVHALKRVGASAVSSTNNDFVRRG